MSSQTDNRTMKRVVLLLGVLLSIQVYTLFKIQFVEGGSKIRTLPILSPVSLSHEREMRGKQRPLNVHQLMERFQYVDVERAPQSTMKQFVETRQKMLALRNERHQLNVRLMDSGVSLLQELTDAQWDFVQSQRDAIKAETELAEMNQLLERWSQ